jgi:hypothetical protein
MGKFVTTNDLVNKFEISTGMYADSKIDAYIDRYEDVYLAEMLGVNLYNDFIDDLDVDNLPQDVKFTKIFEPFMEEKDLRILISKGIKDMLMGFIYFEYLKDQVTQSTPVGIVKQQGENSTPIHSHTTIYGRYNEAIKTYRAIQDYIFLNQATYDGFRGVLKQYAYWI